ncbi:hypothetical protein LguiA_029646 [Lonicera macranthoides]
MVITRSKRRLLDVQPASPTLEITDGTISADNVSPTKRAKCTGRYFDAIQIKANFARMKAKTNAFHKLINTTGFGWCYETNTATAEENVWATYLKVYIIFLPLITFVGKPDNLVFKKKGLHGYEKLFKNFKNTTATGVFGRASNQGPLDSDEDMDVGGGPSMF